MAKGDHIYVQYPGLTHHGIDCGDGSVIHYEGKHKGGIICRISKNAFASGNKIKVKEYGKCYSHDLVVRRAEGRLSEKNITFSAIIVSILFIGAKQEKIRVNKLPTFKVGLVV